MKVVQNSIIYSTVTFLQKAISFLLLPVYTYYLTPEDYGVLNVLLSVSSFLSVFFLLSLNGAATRFHFLANSDEKKIKKIWGTVFSFVFINTFVLGLCSILFHKYLIDPFAKGISFFPLVLLSLVNTILTPIYLFYQTYLQTIQDGKRFGINIFFNFIINVSLILFFLMHLEYGVIGILWANFITTLIFLIYSTVQFLPKIKLGIDREIVKSSVKYSFPLIPHSLSGWTMAMIDRILLNNISGSAQTGIYSLGYQFGNIVNVVTSSVNQAYVPWFFKKIDEGNSGIRRIVLFAELFTLIFSFIAFSISLFSKDILQLMASKHFQAAINVIPIISFAFVFSGLYYFFINTLFLKKTYLVAIVTISSALLGLMLNLILIPKFGNIGAAFASLGSFLISSVLALILSIKVKPELKFNFIKMYFIVFIFIVLSGIFYVPYFVSLMSLLNKFIFYLAVLSVVVFIYKSKLTYTNIIFKPINKRLT